MIDMPISISRSVDIRVCNRYNSFWLEYFCVDYENLFYMYVVCVVGQCVHVLFACYSFEYLIFSYEKYILFFFQFVDSVLKV